MQACYLCVTFVFSGVQCMAVYNVKTLPVMHVWVTAAMYDIRCNACFHSRKKCFLGCQNYFHLHANTCVDNWPVYELKLWQCRALLMALLFTQRNCSALL